MSLERWWGSTLKTVEKTAQIATKTALSTPLGQRLVLGGMVLFSSGLPVENLQAAPKYHPSEKAPVSDVLVQTGDFEVINRGGVELTRIYGPNDPDKQTFVQIFLQKNATKHLAKDIVNYFFLVDPMSKYVNDFTFWVVTSPVPDFECDISSQCNPFLIHDEIDKTHNASGVFSPETIVLINSGANTSRGGEELYPDPPSIYTWAMISLTPNPPETAKHGVDIEISKSIFGLTDLWLYPVHNQNIGRGYANCSREPWVFGWSPTPWKGCLIDENAYRSDDETVNNDPKISHFGAWESIWIDRVMRLGPARYWYPRFKVSLYRDNPVLGKGFPQGSLDLGIKMDIPYGVKNMVIEAIPAPDRETGIINSPGLGPIPITNPAEIARIRTEGYILPAPKLGVGPYVTLPDMTYTFNVRVSPDPNLPAENGPGWKTIQVSPVQTITNEAGVVKDHSAPRGAEKIVFPVLGGGETTNNLTPTLRWQDGNTDVFYYEIQLSKDPTFNNDPETATAAVQWNLIHGGQTNPLNSYHAAPLEPGKTYYWRVRPRVQGDGQPSQWSTIPSFKTSADARVLSDADVEVITKLQANNIISNKNPYFLAPEA